MRRRINVVLDVILLVAGLWLMISAAMADRPLLSLIGAFHLGRSAWMLMPREAPRG